MNTPILRGKSASVKLVSYEVPEIFDELTKGKRAEPKRSMAHFFHTARQWHNGKRTDQLSDGSFPYSYDVAEKLYGGVCYRWIQKVTRESGSVIWNHSWWAATETINREGRCQGIKLSSQILEGAWETRTFAAKRPRKRSTKPQKCTTINNGSNGTPLLKMPLLTNLGNLVVDPAFRDDKALSATDFNYLEELHTGTAQYKLAQSSGRLSHPFLLLSRKHRHYVTYQGEPIISVDSQNGYPSCIGWLLKTKGAIGIKYPLSPLLSTVDSLEVAKWLEWLQTDLYSHFPGDREWVKQHLSMVLTNPCYKYNPFTMSFRAVFPTFLDWLIDQREICSTASMLQNVEVRLMLCEVCPALHHAGYFWLPAHDGISTVPSQSDKVLALIEQVAQSVGYPGTFKIKGVGE